MTHSIRSPFESPCQNSKLNRRSVRSWTRGPSASFSLPDTNTAPPATPTVKDLHSVAWSQPSHAGR